MRYHPKGKTVLYRSKMYPVLKRHCEGFPVREWSAALTAPVPNQGEHLVRDYGWLEQRQPWKPEKGTTSSAGTSPRRDQSNPPRPQSLLPSNSAGAN